MGVGGERAMLLLPLRAPPFGRSNRHLHHRLADACASAIERHAGEQAISVSVSQLSVLPAEEPEPWRVADPREAAPRCVTSQAGFEPALSFGAKYPKSSPPALVEPQDAANQITNKFCRGALNGAPLLRTPWARSAIGIRLIASFPPTGPALLGTRLSGASPGIRVSRSGLRRDISNRAVLRKTKNPPERLAREGP